MRSRDEAEAQSQAEDRTFGYFEGNRRTGAGRRAREEERVAVGHQRDRDIERELLQQQRLQSWPRHIRDAGCGTRRMRGLLLIRQARCAWSIGMYTGTSCRRPHGVAFYAIPHFGRSIISSELFGRNSV